MALPEAPRFRCEQLILLVSVTLLHIFNRPPVWADEKLSQADVVTAEYNSTFDR
jgi:hypothetical protein